MSLPAVSNGSQSRWGAFGKASQEFTDEWERRVSCERDRMFHHTGGSRLTDVAGPSQCDVWREWPSGAPGFQAPVPKVQVEATAEVGPLALRCIL